MISVPMTGFTYQGNLNLAQFLIGQTHRINVELGKLRFIENMFSVHLNQTVK